MDENQILDASGDSEMEQESTRFEVNDLEFCFTCGTILPLPSLEDHLMCRLCKKTIKITRKQKICLLKYKQCFQFVYFKRMEW